MSASCQCIINGKTMDLTWETTKDIAVCGSLGSYSRNFIFLTTFVLHKARVITAMNEEQNTWDSDTERGQTCSTWSMTTNPILIPIWSFLTAMDHGPFRNVPVRSVTCVNYTGSCALPRTHERGRGPFTRRKSIWLYDFMYTDRIFLKLKMLNVWDSSVSLPLPLRHVVAGS